MIDIIAVSPNYCLSELQAVFSVFDKDGDGFVSVEEVGKVLTSMGINPSEDYIQEIFQQVDLDGSVTCAETLQIRALLSV
jgi:Ca2+-binding EF-hand superfamily protein